MKDQISAYYPERKATYDQLRKQVIEAWEAIKIETLDGLIGTMRQSCQDVINAKGMYIK